jgi:hypothetical protein
VCAVVIISFLPHEVDQVLDWAKEIENIKRTNNVRNKKFDINNSDVGVHAIGMLGELAAGRILGVEPDWEIYLSGDNGNDMSAWGMSWQIKTSSMRKLIFNSMKDFITDGAILVHHLASKYEVFDNPTFDVVGAISHTKFVGLCYEHDFGYGSRLVVDADCLTDLLVVRGITGHDTNSD